MENKAILITEDHYNALGVIRSLGEKNIAVDLILTSDTYDSFISRSK